MESYTALEERVHWLSALAGAIACVIALPVLLVTGVRHGDALRAIGAGVFAASALAMFTASALYHGVAPGALKTRLRTLDHSAIFLLIAGTYTPFTIGAVQSLRGWLLFGAVWAIALIGVIAKVSGRLRSTAASSLLYVAMGWIGLLNLSEIHASVTPGQFAWLLAGGIVYTVGVLFYVWKSRRFAHAIWHGFVSGGVVCHFVAVFGLVARPVG